MSKILVTYFSASGVTENIAKKIANALGGTLYEIKPEREYTDEDLDWTNKKSRSSIEMQDVSCRPLIKKENINLDDYDIVLVGFPVWWYTTPKVINTFIESMDFTGKTLIPFCTSGGSSIETCERDLKNLYPKYNWKKGKRFTGRENEDDIKSLIE